MRITLPQITPSPWALEAGRIFQTSSGRFGLSYGTDKATGTPHFPNFCELDTNARAIVALPELLQALADCIQSQSCPDSHANALNSAMDALLQAGATITP